MIKSKPKHEVTLTFGSRAQKEYFLGQLSDGFGENEVDLKWPTGIDLYDAPKVHVIPIGDNWEYDKSMRGTNRSRPRGDQ